MLLSYLKHSIFWPGQKNPFNFFYPVVGIVNFYWRRFILFIFLSALTLPVLADDILVGGTLTEDEVWTSDNVYIIYKDLKIPEGITLTIQPGVTVKIDQGRGILVYGGNLLASGIEEGVIDSVNFLPNRVNRVDGWKWKGISFTGSSGIDLNKILYANIIDAEIAVNIYSCEEVVIGNCSLVDNQNIGIQLYNSKNCRIDSCVFNNNYDGIEMVATDANETSGNLVTNCVLKNQNHNIYLLKAFGGIFIENQIENNLIEGANNGIWMDNGGGPSFGKNYVRKNIFVSNGSVAGYGILLSQDSVEITNNLFWNNHIAIYYDPFTEGSIVYNNSFFQNRESIMLSTGAVQNEFSHNTFSLNDLTVFNFSETEGIIFSSSNIFTIPGQKNVVTNNTQDDIDLTQNYWHASLEEEIQELIKDKNDDPLLGSVYFVPYLPDADTTNPVSPPLSVIKQLVNDQVKISWLRNPESDLRGYKVYYGDFENYSFPNFIEMGMNDTVLFLPDIDISETVAVTALDNATQPLNAQVLGHESPFAIATVYPFAGQDDKLCKAQTEFQISGNTVPFEYDSLTWSTSGDGTFNDTVILHPLYFPGPTDKINGKVEITLSVYIEKKILTDQFDLFIYDDPVAFAGNDTVIFADEEIGLVDATAENQDYVQWLTTGDGSYDDDTLLHPVYTPGPNDILQGEVDLILTAQSQCGMSSDTLTLYLQPYFSVEGKLWYNNELIHDGVILAVKKEVDVARAVDITQADVNGSFKFEKLIEGNYYIYAVPDTLLPNGPVPGYYANKVKWQDAYFFNLNANTYDIDITLPAVDYQLPAGDGSISGHFEMPAANRVARDIYCNSWFDDESSLDYCNDGLSNSTLFLYNSTGTKILDYTLTDEAGNFYFHDLPYGSYIIKAEKTAYQSSASPLITLSVENQHETGVVLELTTNKITIYRTGDTFNDALIEVYPNPTNGILFIQLPENMNMASYLNIYNAFGQLLISKNIAGGNNPPGSTIKLDVSKLNNGVYFGRMVGNGIRKSFSFVKY